MSHLEGALILLQNCGGLPTDTMDLLNSITGSADCSKFRDFVKMMCVNHKRKTDVIEHITCLNLVESDYMTLCRDQRWSKSKSDPVS